MSFPIRFDALSPTPTLLPSKYSMLRFYVKARRRAAKRIDAMLPDDSAPLQQFSAGALVISLLVLLGQV